MYSLWRDERRLGDILERDTGKHPGTAIAGALLPTLAFRDVGPMMQMTYPQLPPVQHPMKPVTFERIARANAAPLDWLSTAPSQEEAIDVEDFVNVPQNRLLEIRTSDGTALATEMIGLACVLLPASTDLREIRRHWGTEGTGSKLWIVTVKFSEY